MMEMLKKCPFCGGDAIAIRKRTSSGSTTREKIPDGTVVVDKYEQRNHRGRQVTRLKWERYGYTIRCSTLNCFGRAGLAYHDTEDAAIAAWNHRV